MAIPAIYAYLVAIEWTQGSYQPSVSIINDTGENISSVSLSLG